MSFRKLEMDFAIENCDDLLNGWKPRVRSVGRYVLATRRTVVNTLLRVVVVAQTEGMLGRQRIARPK